jgi:tetratricopeptide (TPR) repeat protein
MKPIVNSAIKEPGHSISAIKSAWNEKAYEQVASQCRKVLEDDAGNVHGLIYLSRAAAYTGDWPDVAQAGAALTRQSPRDAFNAARKLNRAGRALEAAKIFSNVDIRPDWFDATMADLAWKEGISLLKAGQAAVDDNDVESAKILWVAGAHIAPRSQLLKDRVTDLALEVRAMARRQDLATDPNAYLKAWKEVLRFNPLDTLAATKVARACERGDEKEAVTAWLKVLAIEPDHEVANERLRKFVGRYDLEDHAIHALVGVGRDGNTDPLILEFAESRDEKARVELEKVTKMRLREALNRARSVGREEEPRLYLEVWKKVLVLNPSDIGAARKIISSATALADYSALVDGLIAHLEITPGDPVLGQRLAKAALNAGQEERALEYLARHGLADFSVYQIESLQRRVNQACKNAMKAFEFDHAFRCFHALELADDKDPVVETLRLVLAKKAASQAKEADRQGDLGVAVPLAEKVLRIAPDQPAALTIVARDLLRHRRFGELVALCGPRVKPCPEYASLQKLLDKAAMKLAA